jgi:hypothetical protein
MGGQQRIAALLSLDTRDALIEGNTNQPTDPIDGGLVLFRFFCCNANGVILRRCDAR